MVGPKRLQRMQVQIIDPHVLLVVPGSVRSSILHQFVSSPNSMSDYRDFPLPGS